MSKLTYIKQDISCAKLLKRANGDKDFDSNPETDTLACSASEYDAVIEVFGQFYNTQNS